MIYPLFFIIVAVSIFRLPVKTFKWLWIVFFILALAILINNLVDLSNFVSLSLILYSFNALITSVIAVKIIISWYTKKILTFIKPTCCTLVACCMGFTSVLALVSNLFWF